MRAIEYNYCLSLCARKKNSMWEFFAYSIQAYGVKTVLAILWGTTFYAV